MKLPLIAACLVAGTTWSFASADQTSAVNPKTTAKSYTQVPSAPGSKVVYTSKTAPPIQKFSDQELGAMKAANLAAQKRALAAQNPPQPMVGGGSLGTRRAAAPSGSGGSLAVGGGDDCGSADVITGTGDRKSVV